MLKLKLINVHLSHALSVILEIEYVKELIVIRPIDWRLILKTTCHHLVKHRKHTNGLTTTLRFYYVFGVTVQEVNLIIKRE